jgi:hypothetical protein
MAILDAMNDVHGMKSDTATISWGIRSIVLFNITAPIPATSMPAVSSLP